MERNVKDTQAQKQQSMRKQPNKKADSLHLFLTF